MAAAAPNATASGLPSVLVAIKDLLLSRSGSPQGRFFYLAGMFMIGHCWEFTL